MTLGMNRDALRAQTPRELAECIWLQRYMTKTSDALMGLDDVIHLDPDGPKAPITSGDKGGHIPSNEGIENEISTHEDSSKSTSPNTNLISNPLPHQNERLSLVTEVAMTRAPSPVESLTFKRLLHRLSETVDEQTPRQINLKATVQSTASSGGVMLFEPALERRKSTHLIWISDRSLHMSPWREIEDRILELLKSQSSFASTLSLEIDLSDPERLRFINWTGERVDLDNLRYLGRDLIIALYTDGVSKEITDGSLGAALKTLPRGTRIVWLHPWGLRQLKRTPVINLSRSRPLRVSDELTDLGYLPAALSEISDHGGFALSRWVHYHNLEALSARLIPTRPKSIRSHHSHRESVTQKPEYLWLDRAKRFARSASPGTMDLLALASAVPRLFSFSTDELYALGYHFIKENAARPEPSVLRLYLAEALTSGFLMRADGDRLKFINEEAQRVITSYVDYMTLRQVLFYMIEQTEAESKSAEDDLKLKVFIALRDRNAESLATLLNEEQYAQVKEIALIFGTELISPLDKSDVVKEIDRWLREAKRKKNYHRETDWLFQKLITLSFNPIDLPEPHLGDVLSMIIANDQGALERAKDLITSLSNRKRYIRIYEAICNQKGQGRARPRLEEQEVEAISEQVKDIYELLLSWITKVESGK